MKHTNNQEWLAYVDQLNFGPGNRDEAGYHAFLRAGALKLSSDFAVREVCDRIRKMGGSYNSAKIQSQLQRAYAHVGHDAGAEVLVRKLPETQFCPEKMGQLAAMVPFVDEHWLSDNSPVHPSNTSSSEFLDHLYHPGESVLVFDDFQSQGQVLYQVGLPATQLLPGAGPDGVWFLSNPVDGKFHPNPRMGNKQSRRSEESVTSWRYLVLESDSAPALEWLRILVQLPLKIAAIYTSGGKSIHALIRVDAGSKADWDDIRNNIQPVMGVLGADLNAMTAVRLTRLPGAMRGQNHQQLLYLNPNPSGQPIAATCKYNYNMSQAENLQNFAVKTGVIDQKTASQIEQQQKPTVMIPGGMVTITQSATELFTHIATTKKIFLRGEHVFQVVEHDGRLSLELLKPPAACSRFEDFVQFVTKGKDRMGNQSVVPTVIPKDLAEKYLNAEARRLLPEIKGIINCPIMVERNGCLHLIQEGYDPATKLLVAKSAQIEDFTIEEAVYMITALLRDFDFQTHADKSRAIASLITPALKFGGFIHGSIPADVAEADLSQSGKTYRQQIVAAVYNEVCYVVNKQEGNGVGSIEERFSTALVEGHPFIQFDNVRGKFSSQSLESFMTSRGQFPARPAYSKVVKVDPSKFMIFISSNGFQATEDLSNRASIIRIFKRKGHNFRRINLNGGRQGDLLEFVQTYYSSVLGCIFRVIREWFASGKPRTDETRHDFRDWCQICDWIVQNIFEMPPLMDGHQEAQKRASSPELTFLRSVAVAIAARSNLGKDMKAREIFDLCEEANIMIPSLKPEKRHDDNAGPMAIGKTMGHLFGAKDKINIDAFEVSRKTMRGGQGESDYASKVYVFTRTEIIAGARG